MFAVVFVGELLLSSLPVAGVAFAPAPAAEKSVSENYAMQDVADEDLAEPAAVVEAVEEPVTLEVSEPDVGQERAAQEEKETVVTDTSTEPEGVDEIEPKAPPGDAAGGGIGSAEMTMTPTLMGTPAPPSLAATLAGTQISTETLPPTPQPTAPPVAEVPRLEPGDDANETAESSVYKEEGTDGVADTPEERVESGVRVPFIRLVEGGLVLVALLSGGIAIFLRRRMQ
jgi:hypothetical protein